MKSKAPLVLMEQMVMLLVFALAAALCLQAFAKSDEISLKSLARSNAALTAQNIAELLRQSGGSLEHALKETADRQGGTYLEENGTAGNRLYLFYDNEWKAAGEGDYQLTVEEIPASEKGLQRVRIQVIDLTSVADGQDLLFCLETAWLKEGDYE